MDEKIVRTLAVSDRSGILDTANYLDPRIFKHGDYVVVILESEYEELREKAAMWMDYVSKRK